jgi:hypothetical protein
MLSVSYNSYYDCGEGNFEVFMMSFARHQLSRKGDITILRSQHTESDTGMTRFKHRKEEV